MSTSSLSTSSIYPHSIPSTSTPHITTNNPHKSTLLAKRKQIFKISAKHIWQNQPKPSPHQPYRRRPQVTYLDHSVNMNHLLHAIGQTENEQELYCLMSRYKGRQLSIRFMVTLLSKEPEWKRSLALLDWINEEALYTPSVFAYNVVLRNVLRAKQWELARGLFDEMRERAISPDRYV